jgi:hypothetical protein
MPFAHGVLFAFFLSFAQQECRGWLARRPRLTGFGAMMWFAGFAALIGFPWMKLSGRWIETAGFEPGQRVRITVEHQKLIITPL